MMKGVKQKIKLISATATFCVILSSLFLVLSIGLNLVQAAWQEPAVQAPLGSASSPINVGGDDQGKAGSLLLDPDYVETLGSISVTKQLEVAGDSLFTDLQVSERLTVADDTNNTFDVDANGVGVGVAADQVEPGVKLRVADGQLSVGSASAPVSGQALLSESTGGSHGVVGITQTEGPGSKAGIYGKNDAAGGYGVGGISAGGYGVYGYSFGTSAIVGLASGNDSYAVYGEASGLGTWAGYFEQRLYSADQIIGQRFLASRLPYSQIPYTAGWEQQSIENSQLAAPYRIAFDGTYLWIVSSLDGLYDSVIYIIDPVTGAKVKGPVDFYTDSNGRTAHAVIALIYAGDYIWSANSWEGRIGVTRMRYDSDSGEVEMQYIDTGSAIGCKLPDGYFHSEFKYLDPQCNNNGGVWEQALSDGPVDLVYDAVSGSPNKYIWTINNVQFSGGGHNGYDYGYFISKVNVTDIDNTSNNSFRITTYNNDCLVYDRNQCSDGIDNDDYDDDHSIDSGICEIDDLNYYPRDACVAGGYDWYPKIQYEGDGICTNRTLLNEAECSAPGTYARWIPGICADLTCNDATSCENPGCGSIWHKQAECDDPSCTNQKDCTDINKCNSVWHEAGCENSRCSDQPTCVAPFGCDGTWHNADGNCQNGTLPSGNPDPDDDERLVYDQLGVPSDITFDPVNEKIWVSFYGTALSGNDHQGPGVAVIDADDPTNPANQEVYCAHPGNPPVPQDGLDHSSDPVGIVYVNSSGKVWVLHSPHSSKDGYGQNGIFGIGDSYGPTYTGVDNIQKISTDGTYVWALNSGNDTLLAEMAKLNGNDLTEEAGEILLSPDLVDFTFDNDTSGNPYLWGAHPSSDSLTRLQRNSPYKATSFSILGARSSGLVFDGTYVWSTSQSGEKLIRYDVATGQQAGNFSAAWNPRYPVFDGVNIWTSNSEPPLLSGRRANLSQIKAADGTSVGNYDLPTDISSAGNDMVYDGQNLWISYSENNFIRKIDISNCSMDLSPIGSCLSVFTYPITDNPDQMVFDGQNLWISLRNSSNNSFLKVDPSNGSTVDTYSISDAYPEAQNIRSMVFDGSYLWIGTYYVDGNGKSLYKIDPTVEPTGNFVVGSYALYHDAGRCVSGGNANKYCTDNSSCPESTCSNIISNVRSLTFDGTNIWAVHGYDKTSSDSIYTTRECNDGFDNDNDGKIDYDLENYDLECADTYDLHEEPTGVECSDNSDNDGNGLCDFDGATGYPGCSGQPDPGCASADDISEVTAGAGAYLTRLVAATGQVIESIEYGQGAKPYGSAGMTFDGTNIWISDEKFNSPGDKYVLHKFYAGAGRGLTSLADLVDLQFGLGNYLKKGSFSINGSASFGGNFTVQGDLAAQNNVWDGSDTSVVFGESCPDGEFVRGIGVVSFGTNGVITVNTAMVAKDVAVDTVSGYMFVAGEDSNGRWRLEKRRLADGALDTNFDGDGVVTGASGSSAEAIAIDTSYLYAVGTDSTGMRLEKRRLADGALDTNFDGDGVVSEGVGFLTDGDLVIDTNYVYVIGGDCDDYACVRRYRLNDGFEEQEFSTNSLTVSYTGLAIDSTYIYLVGIDGASNKSLIEKRSKANGILQGSIVGGSDSGFAHDVALGNDRLYVAGYLNNNWRMEKHKTSDLSLDGVINEPGAGFLFRIAIDADNMYLVGHSNPTRWRIEKRQLTDGTLVTSFDGDGIIDEPNTFSANSLGIDSSYMYVVGTDASGVNGHWRIEKRQLVSGQLDNLPGNAIICRAL